MRSRPRGVHHRQARARRGEAGAAGAQAVSRADRSTRRSACRGDRHGGGARGGQWPRIHRPGRTHSRPGDHRAVRHEGSRACRARRRVRHSCGRRLCRRSRWRQPGIDRCAGRQAVGRRHPSARRLAADRCLGRQPEKGARHRRCRACQGRLAGEGQGTRLLRHRRHLAGAGAAAHDADQLSVERHAQLPDRRRRRAATSRLCSITNRKARSPASATSRAPGARPFPMARWCWNG